VEGEREGNKAVEEGKIEKRTRKMCTNKIHGARKWNTAEIRTRDLANQSKSANLSTDELLYIVSVIA
jgi:hypothetical protein